MAEQTASTDDKLIYGIESSRRKLDNIGRSTLYKVCRERGISFVKIGSRSFLTGAQLKRIAGLA